MNQLVSFFDNLCKILFGLFDIVFIGFNFAKFGVPCHATGIIANMAAVQILHLRYEHVGTPNAKLTLYQSDLVPLMVIDNFKKWAQSAATSRNSGMKQDFNELEKKLYGPEGKGGMDEAGVPKGIRILLNLMNQPSKKLHGLSVDAESDVLGDHLGTGAAAVVFRRNGADAEKQNSVVKLSRYGLKTDIENESAILKRLAAHGQHNHIPSILNSEEFSNGLKLQIKLGSVPTTLPAIETAPAGKKAASVFLSSEGVDEDLRLVFSGITSALEHMHSLRICHCDVAPKNIIIASDPAGTNRRAVLIDFSISSSWRESFKGFRGTPNYAHREVFRSHLQNRKTWNPQPEHDKAGLGFTLVFFANCCMCPWNVGVYPKSMDKPDMRAFESVMGTRLEEARSIVRKSDMDRALKTDIEGLLNYDLHSMEKIDGK